MSESVIAAEIVGGAPGWWSGNSVISRVPGRGELLKSPRDHSSRVRFDENHRAVREALGVAGLGAPVVAVDGEVLVQRDLSDTHRVATFTRVRRQGALPDVVALHRAIGASVELTPWSGVAQLTHLRTGLAEVSAWTPPEAVMAERLLEEVGDRLDSGLDRVAFLGDASVSNILMDTRSEGLVAVGGTLAVGADPLQVAGALIAEFSPFFGEPPEIFELYWGSRDEPAFSRAMLYALLEDVKWAYVSRIASAPVNAPRFNSSVYSRVRARHVDQLIRREDYRSWLRSI